MASMKRQPTHPGNILKKDYLKPLSITIQDMASTLGVSRKTLSKIINCRGSVTPDLCQKGAYLLELVRYIHLNPVRVVHNLGSKENKLPPPEPFVFKTMVVQL